MQGHRRRVSSTGPPPTSPPRIYSLDVVLVQGASRQSRAQCLAQSAYLGKHVSFSHTILTVAPGVYIHSTPGDGVHFAKPTEIWGSPHYAPYKLVLRNKLLHEHLTAADLIQSGIEYAHTISGDRYNYLLHIPEKIAKPIRRLVGLDASALFCSELAAKILCDHELWTLPPEQTWPGHFEHERGTAAWDDVTSLHADYAELYTKGADPACLDSGAKYCFDLTESNFKMCQDLHTLKLGNRKLRRDAEAIWRNFPTSD
jgi:hypothetical protein